MAANIPYTSIFSDHGDESPCRTELHNDSVLNILHHLFPDIAAVIHRSGLETLYESKTITIFLPEGYKYDKNISISDAVRFCQSMTCVRYLDRVALNYYTKFILKTLASPYDLTIESFPNGLITVNGSPILTSIKCANGFIHVVQS